MLNTAVILAAGVGRRLEALSLDKPKAFIEVGGVTLLERSVAILVQNGIEEIIIGTGFRSECFDAFAGRHGEVMVRCFRNEDFLNTGSLLTLFSLKEHISTPFLLLESDLLYERSAVGILLSRPEDNAVLAAGFSNAGDEVYIETDSSGHLVKLSKDKNELRNIYAEFVGINKVSLKAYDALCHFFQQNRCALRNSHYESAFSCLGPEYPFFVHRQDDLVWCEIDNVDHLIRARQEIMPLIEEKEKGEK